VLATAVVVWALLYRRSARRRAALPLADRGRTDPAEARRAADHATGSQPVVTPPSPDATNGALAASEAAKAPFVFPDPACPNHRSA
jgi:hypothetical protein